MSEEEKQAIIHLLDKQARYEYAINNDLSFNDEDYEAYIIRQSMINKDNEIERLTAESTKWESKFYDEAKKVDNAIEYCKELMLFKKNSRQYLIGKCMLKKLGGVDKE